MDLTTVGVTTPAKQVWTCAEGSLLEFDALLTGTVTDSNLLPIPA